MSVDLVREALAALHAALLLAVVIVAAVSDLTKGRIHNATILTALLGGFALAYLRGGMAGSIYAPTINLWSSAAGATAMFVLFYVFHKLGGLGGGDVKLMAGIGALTGLRFAIWATLFTSFAGMILAITLLIYRGEMKAGARRSLKGLFRLRRKRASEIPGPDGVAPALTDPEGAKAADAEEAKRFGVPYALAVGAGVVWATVVFLRQGMILPFF